MICGGTFFSEKVFPRTPSKKHSQKNNRIDLLVRGEMMQKTKVNSK